SDDKLQKHTAYFQDNMQTRLIGKMIKHKSVQGIYWFFKGKNILRHKMPPLFHRLKSIHNKLRNCMKKGWIWMKKVMVYAYSQFNLGDDLFIKILCERYPETQFVLYAPKQYKRCFQ